MDSRELHRALMMGILVDAVDIMSCAVAYGEGSLPIEAVGLVAGGAALALGLGVGWIAGWLEELSGVK